MENPIKCPLGCKNPVCGWCPYAPEGKCQYPVIDGEKCEAVGFINCAQL